MAAGDLDDDTQLHADILVIGRAMLDAAKTLSKESGRPLYDYGLAAIQALIVVHPLFMEDDPARIKLHEIMKEADEENLRKKRKSRKKKGE